MITIYLDILCDGRNVWQNIFVDVHANVFIFTRTNPKVDIKIRLIRRLTFLVYERFDIGMLLVMLTDIFNKKVDGRLDPKLFP